MNRTLAREREHWEDHSEPYIFFDDNEQRLILSLLSQAALRGVRVLEIGCGAGVWTGNLARLGAQVYHFDLADAIVERARRAAAPDPTQGFVADMHDLPFSNASFDAIFGSMVMHHTDDHREFGKEVARVLKPSGRAVFHENSARNPFLLLARRLLVGRFGVPRHSSPGEHPLRPQEIENFSQAFALKRIHIGRMVLMQLAVKYLLRTESGTLFTLARRVDNLLYRVFPGLRWMSYYQILEFQAPANLKESGG
ncbi:MAG: class I SAM-dependent methyltransferase [Chloroflexota bacterium]|nr:class I SAM-dependent methyltransferase [Chloroflexota bacterium]